jgi:hypothetical protein
VKRTLLAVAILIAVPAIGQEVEHAPTVAQCQADQRLWLSKLEDDGNGRHGLDDVTFRTLNIWKKEMRQCEVVDPENSQKYYNTLSEAMVAIATRELSFIVRHGLADQFIAEDAAGKR